MFEYATTFLNNLEQFYTFLKKNAHTYIKGYY